MATTQTRSELVIAAVDKATGTLNQINDRMEALNRPTKNLFESFEKFNKVSGLAAVKTAAGEMKDSVVTLGARVVGLGAAYAGAVAGMVGFANSAVNAIDTIGDLSSRYQVNAQSLQAYGSMVQEAGGSVEAAADAMGKLKKAQNEAIHGSKEHQAAFKALGLSAQELKKMSAEEIMAKMSDAFKGSKNDMAKQAILLELMGKNGTVFMDVMNKGSAEYNQRLEEMRADGSLLTDEQIESADAYDKSWSRLTRTFDGVKNMLGGQLAKGLLSTVEATQKWMVANRALISERFDLFIQRLPEIINFTQKALSGLWNAVQKIGSVFMWLFDVLGPTGTALAGLAVLLGPVISSGIQLGFAIGKVVYTITQVTGVVPMAMTAIKGLWAVMVANPIGLVVAAVVGLGIIIYQNWDNIAQYVSDSWDRIKAVFDVGFFDGIIQIWLESWQALANGILGVLKSIIPDRFMPDFLKNFNVSIATERANKTIETVERSQTPPPVLASSGDASAQSSTAPVTAASAAAAQVSSKQEIQNTIKLEIQSDAKTSVKGMSSGSSATKLDVSSGLVMAG